MKAKRVFCIFLSLCMILGMFANLSPVAHATEESNCTHYVEHEPECSNGADCVHECELCAVQSLIDALPTIEEYGIMDEAAKIAAQAEITVALDAYSALSEEEKTQLDSERLLSLCEQAVNTAEVQAEEESEEEKPV